MAETGVSSGIRGFSPSFVHCPDQFNHSEGLFKKDHMILNSMTENGIFTCPARNEHHRQTRVFLLKPKGEITSPTVKPSVSRQRTINPMI